MKYLSLFLKPPYYNRLIINYLTFFSRDFSRQSYTFSRDFANDWLKMLLQNNNSLFPKNFIFCHINFL